MNKLASTCLNLCLLMANSTQPSPKVVKVFIVDNDMGITDIVYIANSFRIISIKGEAEMSIYGHKCTQMVKAGMTTG